MPTVLPLSESTNPFVWEGGLPVMSTFMEQRRTRRFTLQLPLSITPAGGERAPIAGVTKNISSSGVLFTAEKEPDLGSPIEYIVTLNASGPKPVNLRCIGKVVRAERESGVADNPTAGYEVAATLERYEFVRPR